MLARMPESLFQRWLAYAAVEPFGPMVLWRMLAANTAAAYKSQGTDVSEEDFMPPIREFEEEH